MLNPFFKIPPPARNAVLSVLAAVMTVVPNLNSNPVNAEPSKIVNIEKQKLPSFEDLAKLTENERLKKVKTDLEVLKTVTLNKIDFSRVILIMKHYIEYGVNKKDTSIQDLISENFADELLACFMFVSDSKNILAFESKYVDILANSFISYSEKLRNQPESQLDFQFSVFRYINMTQQDRLSFFNRIFRILHPAIINIHRSILELEDKEMSIMMEPNLSKREVEISSILYNRLVKSMETRWHSQLPLHVLFNFANKSIIFARNNPNFTDEEFYKEDIFMILETEMRRNLLALRRPSTLKHLAIFGHNQVDKNLGYVFPRESLLENWKKRGLALSLTRAKSGEKGASFLKIVFRNIIDAPSNTLFVFDGHGDRINGSNNDIGFYFTNGAKDSTKKPIFLDAKFFAESFAMRFTDASKHSDALENIPIIALDHCYSGAIVKSIALEWEKINQIRKSKGQEKLPKIIILTSADSEIAHYSLEKTPSIQYLLDQIVSTDENGIHRVYLNRVSQLKYEYDGSTPTIYEIGGERGGLLQLSMSNTIPSTSATNVA